MSVLLESPAADPAVPGRFERFARATEGEYLHGGLLDQAWVVRLHCERWPMLWDATPRPGSTGNGGTGVRPGLSCDSTPGTLRLRAALDHPSGLTLAIERKTPTTSTRGSTAPEDSLDPWEVRSNLPERLEPLVADEGWRSRLTALSVASLEIGAAAEPAAEPLPAGLAELRLLVSPGASLDVAELRALTEFAAETLDRLEQLGLAAPAAADRIPPRYSAPAAQLVLETIRLDLMGDSCLALDLESVSHIHRRAGGSRPGRRRPSSAPTCRTVRYSEIGKVRTIKKRSWWIVPVGLLFSAWGLYYFLLSYMWRPKLTGLFVFIVFGFIPLMRVVLGYRCLAIASVNQAIVFPLTGHTQQAAQAIAILKRVCAGRPISWDD